MNKLLIFLHLRHQKTAVIKRVHIISTAKYENEILQRYIDKKNKN